MSIFLAFLLSFIGTILLGVLLIPKFKRLKFGQIIRDDGPQSHLNKSGTPTMGGVFFLISITITVLLLSPLNIFTFMMIFALIGFGLVGFYDDYKKVVLKRSLGLKAKEKILAQTILGLLIVVGALWLLERGTEVWVPLVGVFDFGWLFVPFAAFIIIGTTNAVNLTDGLDGLASGTTAIAAFGFMLIFILTKNLEAAIFAAALVGGCTAFLIFNFYPAKVFMGDTGSLGLGAALASLAIMTKMEFFLLLIGGVFVIETFSVIIQVVYFKATGKRVFLMSPLHHHFELKGWEEKKTVLLFYLIAFIFIALAIMVEIFTL